MIYSKKFKSQMVKRMLAGTMASALAKEVKVSQSTLSRWLRDTVASVSSSHVPSKTPSVPAVQRSLREKMRVVLEAEGLEGEALGALLRREGLRSADLEAWRTLGDRVEPDERTAAKSTAAERKRVKQLEKELRRKDKALAETAAMLVLEKKLESLRGVLWGDEDDATEGTNDDSSSG